MNSTLSTSNLYFDSTIFVYFFEGSGTTSSPLKISVWEAYSIKQKRVYKIVKSFYTNELAISDDSRSAKSKPQLSALHEELESFAKRRRNFHLESLVASVKVLMFFYKEKTFFVATIKHCNYYEIYETIF